MATITKSADAPADANTFLLGQAALDLSKGSIETDDRATISNARVNPWLEVKEAVVVHDPTAREDYDPNDPHDNPSADHLAYEASPEAVEAAAANDAVFRHEFVGDADTSHATDPTVAESARETFKRLQVDEAPKMPEPDEAPDPAPEPDPAPAKLFGDED